MLTARPKQTAALINLLPEDLFLLVLANLTPMELAKIAPVCWYFSFCATSDNVWRPFIEHKKVPGNNTTSFYKLFRNFPFWRKCYIACDHYGEYLLGQMTRFFISRYHYQNRRSAFIQSRLTQSRLHLGQTTFSQIKMLFDGIDYVPSMAKHGLTAEDCDRFSIREQNIICASETLPNLNFELTPTLLRKHIWLTAREMRYVVSLMKHGITSTQALAVLKRRGPEQHHVICRHHYSEQDLVGVPTVVLKFYQKHFQDREPPISPARFKNCLWLTKNHLHFLFSHLARAPTQEAVDATMKQIEFLTSEQVTALRYFDHALVRRLPPRLLRFLRNHPEIDDLHPGGLTAAVCQQHFSKEHEIVLNFFFRYGVIQHLIPAITTVTSLEPLVLRFFIRLALDNHDEEECEYPLPANQDSLLALIHAIQVHMTDETMITAFHHACRNNLFEPSASLCDWLADFSHYPDARKYALSLGMSDEVARAVESRLQVDTLHQSNVEGMTVRDLKENPGFSTEQHRLALTIRLDRGEDWQTALPRVSAKSQNIALANCFGIPDQDAEHYCDEALQYLVSYPCEENELSETLKILRALKPWQIDGLRYQMPIEDIKEFISPEALQYHLILLGMLRAKGYSHEFDIPPTVFNQNPDIHSNTHCYVIAELITSRRHSLNVMQAVETTSKLAAAEAVAYLLGFSILEARRLTPMQKSVVYYLREPDITADMLKAQDWFDCADACDVFLEHIRRPKATCVTAIAKAQMSYRQAAASADAAQSPALVQMRIAL